MTSRRFLFVVLLAALVVAGAVAGNASSAPPPPPPSTIVAPSAAVLSTTNAVWFCPGLPTALPHAQAVVTFANEGDTPADVAVTDLADTGPATHVTVAVPANSVLPKARDQLGGPGALTIETFGGRVLVEEGIDGPSALESTPCATQSSPNWYFAAGATPRGVQQWLVLDNPYASDAKVDVTLRTSTGLLKPGPLQSIDIPRRSRDVIAIHDIAVRQARVAIAVSSEVGSVVAAQTIVYTPLAGTPGVALSMGTPVTATDWDFAGGQGAARSNAFVAIANVGTDDAQVDVQAMPETSKRALAPVSLNVAQDDVVWVYLGHCATAPTKACIPVPDGVRYSLDVRSEQNVSIVAQTLARFQDPDTAVGVVTSPGGIAPARGWAFARDNAAGLRSTTLSFFNPGAAPAVVAVDLFVGGLVNKPAALQHVTVPPGRAVTVNVIGGDRPTKLNAAIGLTSTEPIFATRTIVANDEASTSVGVVVAG